MAYEFDKMCGAEEELVNNFKGISKFEDVEDRLNGLKLKLKEERELFPKQIKKLEEELIKRKKKFYKEGFPKRIKEEEKELSNLYKEEKSTHKNWEQKIKDDNERVENCKKLVFSEKKLYFIFNLFYNYTNSFIKKKILKPNAIKLIKSKIVNKERKISELKENPEKEFEKQERSLRQEIDFERKKFRETEERLEESINYLKEIKNSKDYAEALGERKVLTELRKLNDNYFIHKDVYLDLGEYHWYNGTKDMKSAQIDFVVTSPQGIFVIEVKNWSSQYTESQSYEGFSPHEQVDREGDVLYRYLKMKIGRRREHILKSIVKILLPIKNNLEYDIRHKWVMVVSLSKLRNFIESKRRKLRDEEVRKICDLLERE